MLLLAYRVDNCMQGISSNQRSGSTVIVVQVPAADLKCILYISTRLLADI